MINVANNPSRLQSSKAWPYLQLMRPPNLVTAAADIFAGFAVAGCRHWTAFPWLVLSTVALYAGGVVLNDVFDAKLDAVERPERPIPSGRVKLAVAAAFGALLLALGIGSAAFASKTSAFLALFIAVAVVIYNRFSKHVAVLGPVNMGLCRALNLLLGVSAVPVMVVRHWYIGLIPLAYIAAITAVSTGEVHGGKRSTGQLALALLLIVFGSLVALKLTPSFSLIALLPFLALFAWRVLPPFWRAMKTPQPDVIRKAVKAGVLSLIVMDASIAAGYAGIVYGLATLALLLVAGWIAKGLAVT
jgi:4-hydroxybenzoate polyprenyltransferase